ncbi:vacuolar amino acid permease [Punctularia strigosozonata HHB-11173 SS5]|uniref:vacuolar amino acid permease n=1 Tax=Punctularia strigosozonata (strain HHB-11173) TaxID=741275 RepID=UPI00044167FF|nr:vacuolar amino acid permease [Punctularia strigosozonata HHB-11173 SS5]EIN10661.1 vacuolar amino acid permease [Punctularia strigosozonata HHB-11173 SS5]
MTIRTASPDAAETRALLSESPPPSYHAVDDSDADTSSDVSSAPMLNQVSRSDLAWILAGLWSAVFLGALDGTIVATLLSPIGSYFNKSNQASYIGTSYLLSVCCFTPLYGRLSDILGRKGAMLLGLTFFGLGTIACGLAPSMEALIAARAVAGMGGGGSVHSVSSVAVTDLIPLKQRGLYQGMANILFGLGAGLGGPLGGWMNDAFGWRAAFLVQIPVLVFSVVLVMWKVSIKLPSEVENQSTYSKLRRVDALGSFTLVGTVGTLLLGFSLKTSEELPWGHPLIVGLFAASVVFAILFVMVETHWSPYPVMPLRLITQRTPLAVSICNLLGSIAAFSMVRLLYNVPLYFSSVRLDSSTDAGLHLLPHSVALSTGSVFAGWLMRRTGKLYTLTLASAGLSVAANVLVVFWNDDTSAFHLWYDIVPQGFGMASLITSTLIAMIATVSKEDIAVATGITYLFRTTGQVLGVSLSGAILQGVLNDKLRQRIQGPNALEQLTPESYNLRHSTAIIPELDPQTRKAAVDSYSAALRVVFICQAAVAFLAFLACIPIQENPLP